MRVGWFQTSRRNESDWYDGVIKVVLAIPSHFTPTGVWWSLSIAGKTRKRANYTCIG